jgi:hypothetical protein
MRAAAVLVSVAAVVFVLPMAGSSPGAAQSGQNPSLALAADPAFAETDRGEGGALYIRDVTRSEAYLVFVRTESEVVHVNELWMQDGRVAQVDDRKTIVFAPYTGRLLVINHHDSTYVEMPLPLRLEEHLSRDLARRYEDTQRGSLVVPPDGQREVLGCSCREYQVDTWDVRDGDRYNVQSIRVWATTDAPGDMKLFHDFVDHLRQLHDRGGGARRELDKIRGYQLRLVSSEWNGLWRRRLVNEAIEMAWRQPPVGVFDVPEGYRREPRLDPEDLY